MVIIFLLMLMAAGVTALALWPGARIYRIVKALIQKLVLRPKVRLYLNLDTIAPPMSLRALQNLVGTWTSATFVQAGGIGACNHIKDEVVELIEVLQKIIDAKARGEEVDPGLQYELDLELADLQILIMDIAHCRGTDLTDATLLKHHINTLRTWSAPDSRGVQHHIEIPVKDTIITRGPLAGKKSGEVFSSANELALLKAFPGMGKAKLAAIIAKPDPTIAAALADVLNEDEELSDMKDGNVFEKFKP
jgi:hypothetical protein